MSRITIGSNIASLMATRRLSDTSDLLARSFERLSSGMRINRASDDAAGLSVQSSLALDRRVFSQGVRNLNDGLSALNVADSALANLSSIVGRLRELSTQAANGTLGLQQRLSLDDEAQALSKEYTRIARATSFNGLHLFDGSIQGIRLQGGYGTDGSILSRLGGAMWNGGFNDVSSVGGSSAGAQLVTGDLNGDGFEDMVNSSGNGAVVRFGNGDGTFGAEIAYDMGIAGGASVALGDFNGDGVLDVAAGGSSGGMGIRLGLGNGALGSVTSFSAAASISLSNLAIGDFNGDGREDIVFGGQGAVAISMGVLLSNGDGTFRSNNFSGPSAIMGIDVAVGDLNNDGLLDFVGLGAVGGSSYVALGNGDGSFSRSTIYDLGSAPRIELADVNQDGKLDSIASSGSSISVALGNGDGSFGVATMFSVGGTIANIKVGDLNGDGVYDLVSSLTNGSVAILRGNQNGSFSAAQNVSMIGSSATGLALSDMNNDGVLDFVVTGSGAASAGVRIFDTKDGINPILEFSLNSIAKARRALSQFSALEDRLSQQRGSVGAYQSRLGVALGVLQISGEQFASAESRIRDVDVASESAELTRKTILQRAAIGVLGQANLQPQIALSLLRG